MEKPNLNFVMSGNTYLQVIQSLINFLFRSGILLHSAVRIGDIHRGLCFRQQVSTHMGHKGHLFLETNVYIDGILSYVLDVPLSYCLFFRPTLMFLKSQPDCIFREYCATSVLSLESDGVENTLKFVSPD